MKKIYLKNDNSDEACMELLQKLNEIKIEEGQVIEIIAPTNPFLATIKLKSRVAKKLIQLRVKFIVRVDEE